MIEEESEMAVFTRPEATSRYRQEAAMKASTGPTQFAGRVQYGTTIQPNFIKPTASGP